MKILDVLSVLVIVCVGVYCIVEVLTPNNVDLYTQESIWYDRMAALEDLASNNQKPSEEVISDLKIIASDDDDWRIRELAASILVKWGYVIEVEEDAKADETSI